MLASIGLTGDSNTNHLDVKLAIKFYLFIYLLLPYERANAIISKYVNQM